MTLLAALDWNELARWPALWGLLPGMLAVWLMVPPTSNRRQALGAVVGVISLGLVFAGLPWMTDVVGQSVFWVLATVTVGAAAAAIAMRSAVYAAIWFALSLLGTAGLFLYAEAEFLGLATIVVYAGAIVVTLLFVIMLAQPEGFDTYDRISWGWYPKPLSAVAAAMLVAVLTVSLRSMRLAEPAAPQDVVHPDHMARFGAEMFSRHLLAVEVTGTLLLVALVGAISILIQSRSADGRTAP